MRIVLALVLALLPTLAAAQNHTTLEVIAPNAVGTFGVGLDADSYYYFAHPNVAYIRQAKVRGGNWPYTFDLNNEPAGMVVENAGPGETCGLAQSGLVHVACGTITWTPPDTTDATNVELCVTDSSSASDCVTWTIDSTTTGWVFLDAVSGNDTTGAGTVASPWQTLDKAYDSSGANSRILLRAGTYTLAGIPVANADDVNGEENISWNEASRGVQFIGYPGETATIDFEYTGDGCGTPSAPTYSCGQSVPRLRLTGANIVFDHLSITRCMTMCLQMVTRSSRFGVTIRDVDFSTTGPGINGGNSAFVMWASSSGSPSYGDAVYESSFTSATYGSANCHLKLYGIEAMIVDGNTFGSMTTGDEAVLAIKGDVLINVTVRANDFADTHDTSIGGNLNSSTPATAELHHNRVRGAGTGSEMGALTLGVAEVGPLGAIYLWRNTFVGKVNLQNVAASDGPYTFGTNVIINAGGSGSPAVCTGLRATCTTITDSTRIVDSATNLVGAAGDGIVDGNGALTGASRTTYLGTRGYELQATGSPVRLRIRGE